jgi:acetyl-CoA acetyltransferase
MREISIVGFAQTPNVSQTNQSEVELVRQVITGALEDAGLERPDVDFWCSGSSDFLTGRPFSFVGALDAVGAWPPVAESHVEMDGAWAMYEAWTRLLHGDFDVACVYCFGTASAGELPEVLVTQLDPYYTAPLWPDSISIAALQAQALLDEGKSSEEVWAEIAVRSHRDAQNNDHAQFSGERDVEEFLNEDPIVGKLRRHACSPVSDGASAIVIARREVAATLDVPTIAIRGMDHRVEPQNLGLRDLTTSRSAKLAADSLNIEPATIDIAEFHAPFAPQEHILTQSLDLSDGVSICPSGGALVGNPMMSGGLNRIGAAAMALRQGNAERAIGHATAGPALQQNLLCLLEAV